MKAKKMTQKEFFEILEKSGHYARNFEDVLNAIAAGTSLEEEQAKKFGCEAAARMYSKVWFEITTYLETRGYYNDILQDKQEG